MLESAGMGGTADSLDALEDEVRARHAELEKKYPRHGPEYEAGMKALHQHIEQQQAQIKARAEQLPEIAARLYQQWGKDIAGNWTTGQALKENDKDSPGSPLSQSHLDAIEQEARKYGLNPKDLRHHLEMQRLNDWSRGDTAAAVRHGPGGSIWVNPERFLDENAYRQAVEQAWGSEAEKKAAMDRFPELQQRAAAAQLGILHTLGVYNQWEASQPEGMSDVEKLAKFQKEHSGIFSTGAWKVRIHQALLGVASGVMGLAKGAVGVYQAATRSPGAMDLYDKLSRGAASISASSAALPTGQWVHTGTSMLVSSAPSLGAGGLTSLTLKAGGAAFGLRTAAQVAQTAQTWGLRGAAATAGLQTFGGMYGDAVQGYMQSGESEAAALNKAFIPALAGAASTYLLTAAGGTQGVETLLRQPAFRENFRQWFKAVAAGSVKEGLREEAPDQLIQGIIERYTYNPNKPWNEIVEETLQAGIGGALLGGAAEGANTQGTRTTSGSGQQPASQPEIPSPNTPSSPPPAGEVKPAQASPSARPSGPPKDLETSQKIIANLEERQKHRPLGPVEQADLDQARGVVAESASAKARPSGPPPTLQTAQARIHNIMNRPPEQRGHPTTQADLEQARQVVQDHVQKLESQKEPLSDTQQKELADARAALARLSPANGTGQPGNGAAAGNPTPDSPQPQNSTVESRLQFSQGGAAKPNPGQVMQSLAGDEGRFRRGKASESKDFAEIAKEYALPGELSEVEGGNMDGDRRVKKKFRIELVSGGHAYIFHGHDGKVWVDSRDVRGRTGAYGGPEGQPVQGGDLVYQAAMTYAHNNGLQFVGDPDGVSEAARFRRVSQMLSNALRHGTTEHLVPYQPSNGDSEPSALPNWHPQKGPEDKAAYQHNINQLALAEMHEVEDIMRRRADFADSRRADAAKRGKPPA